MADTLNDALEALNSMTASYASGATLTINNDLRTIVVPQNFIFGVYNDKNVLSVEFSMPRFYDNIDLSEFSIQINYMSAAGVGNIYEVTEPSVGEDTIEFEWLLDRGVFLAAGDVSFIVCLRKFDPEDAGAVLKEFNTTVARGTVLEGLEVENPEDPEAYSIMTRLRAIEQTVSAQATAVARSQAQVGQIAQELQGDLDDVTREINAIKNQYGAPLVAATAAAMTDVHRVYVYTGSETGYTFGNWYYYNGTTWTSGGTYNGEGVTTDKSLSVSDMAADAKAVGDEIAGLKEDYNEITETYESHEETVEVDIPLDLSDVRVGKRTSDTVGDDLITSSSNVTTAIIRAFVCEANKTYKLTITNGETPALVTQRATVVVSTLETSNATVTWSKKTTNTSNEKDIVEFTPDVSGYVYFNLDKNYQSIAVTTTETHTVTEKTAIDKVAREDIEDLPQLVETVSQLSDDVSDLSDNVETITEIYETHEETETVSVEMDTSDIRNGFCSQDVGQTVIINSSQHTKCVVRAFECEANKTYTLTITNGQTPASIAERATVVVATGTTNLTVAWVKLSTNTSNATDIVEFTPTVSGWVLFNLDANYQSIAVTTTRTYTVTEKTAIDLKARDDIEELGNLEDEIDEITEEITEEITDGTYEVPVTIDSSTVLVGKRAGDNLNASVTLVTTGTTGMNSSSVTSCVFKTFMCEANHTYQLTVMNGSTPASIAERGTVVVVSPVEGKTYGTVVWTKRTTNTNKVYDKVIFTPTSAGYVYFNVDKNFQSISVAEIVDNVITTAVDVVARNNAENISKTVFGHEIQKEVTFESGTFTANLSDESGNGYRSNIISGVKGCAVCIKVDPSYYFVYGDGENALMTIYGVYVIHPKTDTIRIGLSDTPENVSFEMRIYHERGHKGKYDVIVAASDSAPEDKAVADIVCDGVNDELDLQFAVNWNFDRQATTRYADMCNVLLLPGHYEIDSFTQQYTADGQLMRSKYAVVVGNNCYDNYAHYKYDASISGCYEHEHTVGDSSTIIEVTDTALSTLDSTFENVVMGIALLASTTTGSIRMNMLSITVKNLMIYTNGLNNRIIGIDAYQAGATSIKDVDIWASRGTSGISADMIAAIPEGSIGIRAGRGSCYGVRQRIKGCRISGFHEGIAICGEHFICEDNLELRCYYGFTLNNYQHGGAVWHPNIFFGNSVEQCYKMGKIAESGSVTTLVYIGGSVENKILNEPDPPVKMLPIDISPTSQVRGRIESDSLESPYNSSMFVDGAGSSFVQTIYPW